LVVTHGGAFDINYDLVGKVGKTKEKEEKRKERGVSRFKNNLVCRLLIVDC
jgi:hypothetical protein